MASTGEATDEELFAAYRGGDQAAFEQLFRRYQGPLGRHLERLLDDRAAAEDLMVETFQRLHIHRDRFRAGAAVRPWVYTIARNLVRKRHRRTRLARWLPLDVVDAIRPAADPDPPGGEAEVRRRVATALCALPSPQREACSLRLLGELPLEEIAAVTGASLGTVKSRLFYGQRRLREALADMDPRSGGAT